MSISACIGLPRHGKSYSAIELFILQAVKEKRTVCTNIPLLPKFFEDYPEANIQVFDIDKAASDDSLFDAIPPGCLCVFDELWRIWPAGMTAAKIPKRQMEFIKEHGHYLSEDGREMDIILVTQVLDDIAAPVALMCETTILTTKLTDLGLKNNFRRDYYRGKIRGFTGKKDALIKSDLKCSYKKEIYQYYKSHTKSSGVVSADGGKGVIQASIFGSLGFKIGVGAVVFLIVSVFFLFKSTLSGVDELTNSNANSYIDSNSIEHLNSDFVNSGQVVPSVYYPLEPVIKESTSFRIVGHLVIGQRPKFYLVSNGRLTRRLTPKQCGYFDEGLRCEFRGEYITEYSGYRETESNQFNQITERQISNGAQGFKENMKAGSQRLFKSS